jgi:hypothetical protein
MATTHPDRTSGLLDLLFTVTPSTPTPSNTVPQQTGNARQVLGLSSLKALNLSPFRSAGLIPPSEDTELASQRSFVIHRLSMAFGIFRYRVQRYYSTRILALVLALASVVWWTNGGLTSSGGEVQKAGAVIASTSKAIESLQGLQFFSPTDPNIHVS